MVLASLWKDAQVLATLRSCTLRNGRSFRVGGPWAWLGTVPGTFCSSGGRGTEGVPGSSRMEDYPLCSLFLWPVASALITRECLQPFQVLCRARCPFSPYYRRLGGILGRLTYKREKSTKTSELNCLHLIGSSAELSLVSSEQACRQFLAWGGLYL